MLKKDYDVVVAGAGPAGAAAARSAAGEGMRVLLVERKNTVGRPVRCAEYVPSPLLGEVGLGHAFVVQWVKGMKTILPGGEETTTSTPGAMIHRDLFDQTLCRAAQEAGSDLLLDTAVLSSEGNRVLLKNRSGDLIGAEARVVIGADGPRSRVGTWIGSVNTGLIAAVQVRAPLVRPLEHTEVYFDHAFYGGYGWLFPKGNAANIGLGIKMDGSLRRGLWEILDQFVDRLAREGKIRRQFLGRTAGLVPAVPLRNFVKGHFALAGDSAGQTHPITGAGVFQAVTAGMMAGKWAAKAIREEDMGLLMRYEEEWRDLFGETHERAFRRRQLLENEWEKLEQVIRRCWVAFREYYEERGSRNEERGSRKED